MAATCEELASQSIEMQSEMDLLKYGTADHSDEGREVAHLQYDYEPANQAADME
jgi:hypothetical protein